MPTGSSPSAVAEIERLVQYHINPALFLDQVEEVLCLDREGLKRSLVVSIALPEDDRLNCVSLLLPVATPARGTDVHIVDITVNDSASDTALLSKSECEKATSKLLQVYFNRLFDSWAEQATQGVPDEQEINSCIESLEMLEQLSKVGHVDVNAVIASVFLPSGKLKALQRYRQDFDEVMQLYATAQFLGQFNLRLVRVPLVERRATIKYSYTEELEPVFHSVRGRLRHAFQAPPMGLQIYSPMAKRCVDYTVAFSAPDNHYIDQDSVVCLAANAPVSPSEVSQAIYLFPKNGLRSIKRSAPLNEVINAPGLDVRELSSSTSRSHKTISGGNSVDYPFYVYYKIYEKTLPSIGGSLALVLATFIMMVWMTVLALTRTAEVGPTPAIVISGVALIVTAVQLMASRKNPDAPTALIPRVLTILSLLLSVAFAIWLSYQPPLPQWHFDPNNYEWFEFFHANILALALIGTLAGAVFYMAKRCIRSIRRYSLVKRRALARASPAKRYANR